MTDRPPPPPRAGERADDRLARARKAKGELRDRLATDDRVLGVGIEVLASGYGLRVLVERTVRLDELGLAAVLDDLPVTVVAIGDVRALPPSPAS